MEALVLPEVVQKEAVHQVVGLVHVKNNWQLEQLAHRSACHAPGW